MFRSCWVDLLNKRLRTIILKENEVTADKKNGFRIERRGHGSAFPIAEAGYPFILAGVFATLTFALVGMRIPSVVALFLTFFVCYFFRDPLRAIPMQDDLFVSPADGKVVSIRKIDKDPYTGKPALYVGIFMSIFDVHVNRSPYNGKIVSMDYKPGSFIPADKDKAPVSNEQNAITLESDRLERELVIVQIAGLVARRIICWVSPGQEVEKGERFGLICFGSRVDLYLPVNTRILVVKGDRVKAGTSVIGKVS